MSGTHTISTIRVAVLLTSFLGSPESPDGVISNECMGGEFNLSPFRDCNDRPVTAPFKVPIDLICSDL